MPRPLSERLLKRKVAWWGWYSRNSIVIIFEGRGLGIVNLETNEYRPVRTWRVEARNRIAALATKPALGMTLGLVLELARRELQGERRELG